MNTINKNSIIKLPKITDERGNLSFIEKNIIPFEMKRLYFLYEIPVESMRGGHSHKEQEQVIIPISGSFEVVLDNGKERKTYHLNTPNEGLYITKNTWRELKNFSAGAVCLVVSSGEYDEGDYIRNYDEFIRYCRI